VKLVDISGPREMGYMKHKIDDLEINSKNKNTKDLYRGISEFNKG
jgi:hypothetical protein